jgi:hypothetical protein
LSVLLSGAADAMHPDTVEWSADAKTATFGFAAALPDGDYTVEVEVADTRGNRSRRAEPFLIRNDAPPAG